MLEGADELDAIWLRPDVQSRAKFAIWLKRKTKENKKQPKKTNQNAKGRQEQIKALTTWAMSGLPTTPTIAKLQERLQWKKRR